MHTLRTRFKKDIVCEFLPPTRPQKTQKVIILASGMPGYPAKPQLMSFLARKGYWVFNPRYRGTWESGGKFLQQSPEQDIIDIIDDIPKGFTSIPDSPTQKPTTYKLTPKNLYLIGSSFGGPAVILASRDTRVTKVIASCPVVDWASPGKDEPLDWLEKFVNHAFGEAYRFLHKDFRKLSKGTFYNPTKHLEKIDGSKLLFIHATDDAIVPYSSVYKFSKQTKVKLITLPRGGHIGTSIVLKSDIWKKVSTFLKS